MKTRSDKIQGELSDTRGYEPQAFFEALTRNKTLIPEVDREFYAWVRGQLKRENPK